MRSMKYFNASILPAGNEMESNAIAIANSQPPNLCLTNQSWLKMSQRNSCCCGCYESNRLKWMAPMFKTIKYL